MPLPPLTRDQVLGAIAQFDRELRSEPPYLDWESNGNFEWVLTHRDGRYPIKELISLASGVPRAKFSGGPKAVHAMGDLGFVVEALPDRTGAGPRAWVFQARPGYWDVRGALGDLAEFEWMVNQHHARIKGEDGTAPSLVVT